MWCQVRIYSSPELDFEKRIHVAIDTLKIIDTHEHLLNERQSNALKGDFGCLFNNYQFSDLVSSGAEMTTEEIERKMRDPNLNPTEKWELIEDHWDEIKTTGYGRMVNIAARGLFDIPELNKNTYMELSERVEQLRNREDFYEFVLKTKAKIDLSLLIGFNDDPSKQDNRFFKSLYWNDGIYLLDSFSQVVAICESFNGSSPSTLAEYEKAIEEILRKQIFVNGVIGLKIMMAYKRTLQCDNVPRGKAMEIFQKLRKNKSDKFSFQEVKPLQDYLLFYVFSLCEKYELPVQIHTGMQTFNQNYITYTNPTGLTEAFLKFPRARFALLHASYPYGGELAALAKKFPNIFIDMTWASLISPSYTIRYLQEYIETVPINKIVAFGGDCHTPEGVYAASVIARETVENALVPMVRSGYLRELEAVEIAKKILRTNAIDFYGLQKFLKN
jgi:hypothetical protein